MNLDNIAPILVELHSLVQIETQNNWQFYLADDVKKTLDNIYDENTDEALYDNLDKSVSEYKQFNKIQKNANKTSLFLAKK